MVDKSVAEREDREAAVFWLQFLRQQTKYDAAGRPLVLAKHGGWLTMFQAMVSLVLIAFAYGFVMAGLATADRTVDGLIEGSVRLRLAWQLAIVVAPVLVGLVLIAARARVTRTYWLIALPVIVFTVAALVPARRGERQGALSWWLIIWWFYWLRSYRVLATFTPERVRPSPAFRAARAMAHGLTLESPDAPSSTGGTTADPRGD